MKRNCVVSFPALFCLFFFLSIWLWMEMCLDSFIPHTGECLIKEKCISYVFLIWSLSPCQSSRFPWLLSSRAPLLAYTSILPMSVFHRSHLFNTGAAQSPPLDTILLPFLVGIIQAQLNSRQYTDNLSSVIRPTLCTISQLHGLWTSQIQNIVNSGWFSVLLNLFILPYFVLTGGHSTHLPSWESFLFNSFVSFTLTA